MFINEKTWDFVRQHRADDVRRLALQGAKDEEVELTAALRQIAGWQTARRKLPSWAAVEGVVYPPHLNMEQCSSEQTARYKAQLVSGECSVGQSFVDLTGGFGVDFYFMSQGFGQRVYVEQDAALCAIAEHNFRLLGLSCSVCCADSAAYLTEMEHASVIYLDPARRNEHGGRTYGIEDCTPNVLELLPLLQEKADSIVIKLSPMLDWRKAVDDHDCVSEVHIVSVDNECKELLLVLGKGTADGLTLACVNNDSTFTVVYPVGTRGLLRGDSGFAPSKLPASADVLYFLYEPNASVMKAGCFEALAERFPVSPVSANSHLFLSSVPIAGFPGRGFQISAISSLNKRDLKTALAGVSQANITVRNFPLTAQQLRQRLKMKDGGSVYLFATTIADGSHKLFICRKIG